ncbi:hypothetical protein V6N13_087671 [Hibiscus sabdariffa]
MISVRCRQLTIYNDNGRRAITVSTASTTGVSSTTTVVSIVNSSTTASSARLGFEMTTSDRRTKRSENYKGRPNSKRPQL